MSVFVKAHTNQTPAQVCESYSIMSINVTLMQEFKVFLQKHDKQLTYVFESSNLRGRYNFEYNAALNILNQRNSTLKTQTVVCHYIPLSKLQIAAIICGSAVGFVAVMWTRMKI